MVQFDDGLAATRLPGAEMITTDVLIVGSGPAGASAALFLSSLGVDNIMITKYRWTANTPRAHITNQRTMEIFRQHGLARRPVVGEDADLDQAVRLEGRVGLLADGGGEPVAADHHDRVEVVRVGAVELALRRGEEDGGHPRIIEPA